MRERGRARHGQLMSAWCDQNKMNTCTDTRTINRRVQGRERTESELPVSQDSGSGTGDGQTSVGLLASGSASAGTSASTSATTSTGTLTNASTSSFTVSGPIASPSASPLIL